MDQRFRRRPFQQSPSGGDVPTQAGESAAVADIPGGPFPMGPRGRDAGGFPTVIPVGVPPAVAGSRHAEVPKDLRFPRIPPEIQHFPGVAIPAATGDIIAEGLGFPMHTLWIDNFSSVWLHVEAGNHYVPPWSIGWVLALSRGSTTFEVRADAPPGITQPSLTAGGFFSAIASEDDRIPQAPGALLRTTDHP